jgi:hypothetical protein
MIGKELSQRSREMAIALHRWDEDGGAAAVAGSLSYQPAGLPAGLEDGERRILECLGAALVGEWNELTADLQRKLFERATAGKPARGSDLRARIAQFLHDRKNGWAARYRYTPPLDGQV